jgi:hypothetical protein
VSRGKLKVYSWEDPTSQAETKALGDEPWHCQAYAFTAATSRAEVARLAGVSRPSQLFNLGETGNTIECETARARPGVVFLRSMNGGRNATVIEREKATP